MKSFLSVSENISTQIVEKKSKFIANLYYIESQEEAEFILQNIKKKYFDAKHHCFSYRILQDESILERASDDGEPSGTAGAPMLNILKKKNLINVIIIVTRYFGGILLGTGGLVRAYSEATLKAIENATIIKKALGIELEVELEYSDLEKFKYYCNKNDINIIKFDYTDKVISICNMKKEIIDKVLMPENINELKILKYKIGSEKYIDLKE